MAYNFELITTYTGQERYGHASVVFDNRMWVIQGYSGSADYANIASSKDGVTWDWISGTTTAPTPARAYHKCVVFDNKLYLVGGMTSASVYLNDCWMSGNGRDWTKLTNTVFGNLLGRACHEMVVYDGRMWIFGGNNATISYHDVWNSVDGVTWTKFSHSMNLPWIDRDGHAACVFDSKVWLTAGYCLQTTTYQRDCWYTENFMDWTRTELPTDFVARSHHTMTVYDSKMVIIGGETANQRGAATTRADLYSSTVGTKWLERITTLPFSRTRHTALNFDGRLWVIAGDTGTAATATVYRSNSMEWQDKKI